jgi:gas vesicle protein
MAGKNQWRKFLNIQDVGDVVSLTRSLRKMLARKGQEFEHRGEQTAKRIRHDVEESHLFEDIANFADKLARLIARKRHEFERTSHEAVEHLKTELRDSPVVESVEETATKVRDTVDEKSYKVAKQIVDSHEERHRNDGGDAGIFVVGAILGGLLGAIAAFWFAPQSGEETRREIQERGEELRDEIEHVTTEARHKIEGDSIDEAMEYGKAEARKFQEVNRMR